MFKIILSVFACALLFHCKNGSNGDSNNAGIALLLLSQKGSAMVSTLPVSGLNKPEGISSSNGTIYITDSKNNAVKKITSEKNITTVGTQVTYSSPEGIFISSTGDVFVANTDSSNIIKIDSSGVASVFFGNGTPASVNGNSVISSFVGPEGIFVDSSGTIYIADSDGHNLRTISGGISFSLAGSLSNNPGFTNDIGANASFTMPKDIVKDSNGNVFVSDNGNNVIRKISAQGDVSVFAGSMAGLSGKSDGFGTAARFNAPYHMAIDASNNIYVVDGGNNTIRKITPNGTVTTLAGIAGTAGSADGIGISATFNKPRGIALDKSLNVLYICGTGDSLIRKITNF